MVTVASQHLVGCASPCCLFKVRNKEEKSPDEPTVGFGLWRDGPGRLPCFPALCRGPSCSWSPGWGRAGREAYLRAPQPWEGGGLCLCRRAGKGDGHPASLSLAQPHFQKFFLPVRRGKKSLGSLLGCQEGGGQVGTRFPRALTGQAGALGPPAWAKGRAQPWDKSGPQPEALEELTSGIGAHPCPCPARLCLWLQNRDRKKEGLEIAGLF